MQVIEALFRSGLGIQLAIPGIRLMPASFGLLFSLIYTRQGSQTFELNAHP